MDNRQKSTDGNGASPSDFLSAVSSWVSDKVDAPAAVDVQYPTPNSYSLRKSLLDRSMLHPKQARDRQELGEQYLQDLHRVLRQLEGIERLSKAPIIAISGLLNAGKSSLVASFLSSAGRSRVLTGSGNSQGTHRFILWLPSRWKSDSELWGRWMEQLARTFGRAPELLSDQPEIAFAQYNGQSFAECRIGSTALTSNDTADAASLGSAADQWMSTIESPLVAVDSALDELGLGLMECPDIQTGILDRLVSSSVVDSDLPERRRQLLARAARVCSAFLVVTKLRDLHDRQAEQLLQTIRDSMPGLPRILAVNFAKRRYTPSEVWNEALPLVERHGLSRVYMAYDFRGDELRERLPPYPTYFSATESDPRPLFFRIGTRELDSQAPRPNPNEFLLQLGKQLDQGELVQQWLGSLHQQLHRTIEQSMDWMVEQSQLQRRRLTHLHRSVASALVEFSGERNSFGEIESIRLQTSRQIVAQIVESLQRTAPWWAWPSLMVDRTVAWTKDSVSKAAKNISPAMNVGESLQSVRNWFRRSDRESVVTADRLRRDFKRAIIPDDMPSWSDEHWLVRCQRMIDRFQEENQTRLQSDELDVWTSAVWQTMPLKRKLLTGIMPVAPVFAPLAAVMFIPFDFGGSAVLVFASLKELLAAVGIAGAWMALQGGQTPDVAEKEAAWQQLCDLAALACDELGMPRPEVGVEPLVKIAGESRPLLQSKLPTRLPPEGATVTIWHVRPDFQQAVAKVLERQGSVGVQ